MNKKILTGLSLLSTLVLSSCDIYSLLSFDLLSSEEISSYEEQSFISTTSSEYASSEIISSSIEISTSEYESSIESITSSSQEEIGYYKLDDLTTNVTYADISATQGITVIPAKGKTKVLVLPIEFSDAKFSSSFKSDLNRVLNGNGKSDTGYWESVSSYYFKSSYGKAELQYDIADTYSVSKSAGRFYYDCLNECENYGYGDAGSYGSTIMLEAAVTNFKNHGGDTRQYDSDKDGFIDAVIMIYSCHNSEHYKISYTHNRQEYVDDGELYWAFCYWDFLNYNPNVSNPNGSLYFWLSYDFMYEVVNSPKVDSHTLIHETGHMFGLDDYYGDSTTKVTGTMSMMDYNIMDLDPFSKLALGWSSAYVVTDSCTINLKPMTTNGEVIIIPTFKNSVPSFNNTPFDEYMIVELYTPNELNLLDSTTAYSSRRRGFNEPGIRLWHVDGRLVRQYADSELSYPINYVNDPTNFNDSYWYYVGASNTYKNEGVDSSFNLLSLVDASGRTFSNSRPYSDNNSLFKSGSRFSFTTFKNFFPLKTSMNNGNEFKFDIFFESVSSQGATITFTRN